MEHKLESDVAQYVAAHVQLSNTADAIGFHNRAFAVTALRFWTVSANSPAPLFEPVTVQPVPESFAAGYSDALD